MKYRTGLILIALAGSALATDPQTLSQGYATQARADNPAFSGFSAKRGEELYFRKMQQGGETISCTTCHTSDARKPGETKTFRSIRPLAPAINPDRFSDERKVEKWFKRNCKDVLARECSASEKGDFIAYLQTLK